jgi:hypothetical protein
MDEIRLIDWIGRASGRGDFVMDHPHRLPAACKAIGVELESETLRRQAFTAGPAVKSTGGLSISEPLHVFSVFANRGYGGRGGLLPRFNKLQHVVTQCTKQNTVPAPDFSHQYA